MSDDKTPYLHLDTEKFRDLLSTAVFKVLDEKSREELLTRALKNLIEPKKQQYSTYCAPSDLQQIFDSAVRRLAEDVVKKKFEQDEVKAKVSALVDEAIAKIYEDHKVREKMTSALAYAFRDSINKLAGLSDEAFKKLRGSDDDDDDED